MLLGRPTPTALTYPGLTRRILKPWSKMASVTLLISTLETILDMSLNHTVKDVLVMVVAIVGLGRLDYHILDGVVLPQMS